MVVKHVIITGLPGVGKTTLIKKVCDMLKEKAVCVHGFFTEELREGRQRIGFDVVSLKGETGMLSRISERLPSGCPTSLSVGKYYVVLRTFEEIALPAIRENPVGDSVLIIDEIGKMEMFSRQFEQAVKTAFDRSKSVILATIPVNRGRSLSFLDGILKNPEIACFTVTRENRDSLAEQILNLVLKSLKNVSSSD